MNNQTESLWARLKRLNREVDRNPLINKWGAVIGVGLFSGVLTYAAINTFGLGGLLVAVACLVLFNAIFETYGQRLLAMFLILAVVSYGNEIRNVAPSRMTARLIDLNVAGDASKGCSEFVVRVAVGPGAESAGGQLAITRVETTFYRDNAMHGAASVPIAAPVSKGNEIEIRAVSTGCLVDRRGWNRVLYVTGYEGDKVCCVRRVGLPRKFIW